MKYIKYLEEFEKDLRRNMAENSVKSYVGQTKTFLGWLKDRDINHYVIQEFVDGIKGKSTLTVKKYIASISSFCKFLIDIKEISDSNPASGIKSKAKKNKKVKIITQADYDKIIEYIKTSESDDIIRSRYLLIYDLGYNCAMRIDEILSLTRADIQNEFIRIRDGKRDKDRNVPYYKKTKTLINEYLNLINVEKNDKIFNIGYGLIPKKMQKYCDMIGVVYGEKNDGITFHSLRHARLNYMLNNKDKPLNPQLVSQYAGNTVKILLENYSHATDRDLLDSCNI